MTEIASERRLHRSNDLITALHYQLATTRREAGFEALVLVDDAGTLVAGAGAWPLCEELAAFAPLLLDRERIVQSEANEAAETLRSNVALHTFSLQGTRIVLAARGGDRLPGINLLERAAAGCHRILDTPS